MDIEKIRERSVSMPDAMPLDPVTEESAKAKQDIAT